MLELSNIAFQYLFIFFAKNLAIHIRIWQVAQEARALSSSTSPTVISQIESSSLLSRGECFFFLVSLFSERKKRVIWAARLIIFSSLNPNWVFFTWSGCMKLISRIFLRFFGLNNRFYTDGDHIINKLLCTCLISTTDRLYATEG